MTPAEAASIRNLTARILVLERRIDYLERQRKRDRTIRQKAVDQARYWHGIALTHTRNPEHN